MLKRANDVGPCRATLPDTIESLVNSMETIAQSAEDEMEALKNTKASDFGQTVSLSAALLSCIFSALVTAVVMLPLAQAFRGAGSNAGTVSHKQLVDRLPSNPVVHYYGTAGS